MGKVFLFIHLLYSLNKRLSNSIKTTLEANLTFIGISLLIEEAKPINDTGDKQKNIKPRAKYVQRKR